MDKKISVTIPTLESHNHIIGDIERGVKVYNGSKVEFMPDYEDNELYIAKVPHKGSFKTVSLSFSRDGRDIEHHHCDCTWRLRGKQKPVCRHVVAAVLAIQGGIVETKLTLGKTASVTAAVTEANTAKAVGSGSLDVFATPSMAALMEQAACKVLEDCLEVGQTSVGTLINVEHTAASPIGATITATATVTGVFGRKVEFDVSASDGTGEIGKGKHVRAIVDGDKFMKKVGAKK